MTLRTIKKMCEKKHRRKTIVNELLKEIPSAGRIHWFRRRIMEWFNKNGREYPWRETPDPFKVLIAEIMLRRTKADQVKKVYEEFFSKYPNVAAVANADDEELARMLYPLGLKWRTSAFAQVARDVQHKYQSKVPETREELVNLPGVGNYVAGAVLSIAYNKKEWIVDSNIVRLFKRYFGITTSKEGRRDKHIIKTAKIYAICVNPKIASLAILDFTALVCTPRHPRCSLCPLTDTCRSYSSKRESGGKQCL